MNPVTASLVLYAIGSVCFLVGTLVTLVNHLR